MGGSTVMFNLCIYFYLFLFICLFIYLFIYLGSYLVINLFLLLLSVTQRDQKKDGLGKI